MITSNPRDICNTPLAEDEQASIYHVLSNRFSSYLKQDESLQLSCFREDVAAFIELQIGNGDTLYDMAFFVDNINKQHDHPVYLLVEFVGAVLDEFFEHDRESFLPLVYKVYPFRGYDVCARGQVRHPDLEEAANRLLEQAGDVPEDIM